MKRQTTLGLMVLAGITLLSVTQSIEAQTGFPGSIRITDRFGTPDLYEAPRSVMMRRSGVREGLIGGTQIQYDVAPPGVRRSTSPIHVWLANDGSVSYPPDYGWSQPTKIHYGSTRVQYQRYWPDYWYGQNVPAGAQWTPRFPMIYTPTDTTQLGYSYQHVPTWQPKPWMLPASPWPSQWHRYQHPVSYRPAIHNPGCQTCPGGTAVAPTPVDSSAPVQESTAPAAPLTPVTPEKPVEDVSAPSSPEV